MSKADNVLLNKDIGDLNHNYNIILRIQQVVNRKNEKITDAQMDEEVTKLREKYM